MTKTAPAIFLIMHEVVFRPVPLFVHVSSWGNWFLSRTAQSVNKPFQGVGKNRGCLRRTKTSGRTGCYLVWILASRACSKCSFEKIQPYITLTIYEISLYFSFQWVREKPNSLVYICITATGTLAVYPPEETNNKKNNEKMLRKERASAS